MKFPDNRTWTKKGFFGLLYFCEECGYYKHWDLLGPDYGGSHFFCEECLNQLELNERG